MKFGKLLQQKLFPEWKQHYISYNRLKRLIHRLAGDGDAPARTSSEETLKSHFQEFFDCFEMDLTRITEFLGAEFQKCKSQFLHLGTAGGSLHADEDEDALNSAVGGKHVGLEEFETQLLALYRTALRLQAFRDLNILGCKKILKKLDKHSGLSSAALLARCEKQIRAAAQSQEVSIDDLVAFAENMFHHLEPHRGASSAERLKVSAHRKRLISSKQLRLQVDDGKGDDDIISAKALEEGRYKLYPQIDAGDAGDLKAKLLPASASSSSFNKNADQFQHPRLDEVAKRVAALREEFLAANPASASSVAKWRWILLGVVLYAVLMAIPILEDDPRAHRCIAVLTLVTILWVTEALPFFLTAILIAPLCVFSFVFSDADHIETLSAKEAASKAASKMFNDTVLLVFGGFTISTAFCQCGFELRLAAWIQKLFGERPRIFLLAIMLMAWGLSMWISNVAAPVLCTTVITPIMSDFEGGHTNSFSRALLLGLAFASNIGGMLSPVSSPQNSIAMGYLDDNFPDQNVSFLEFLEVSIPFALVCVLCAWAYLNYFFLGKDLTVTRIPPIGSPNETYTRKHYIVLAVTGVTIALWCSLSWSEDIFGSMGIVAMLPVAAFFGTGILTKDDVNTYPWALILLIGGGSVLGEAVDSSDLLQIFSDFISPYLGDFSQLSCTLIVVAIVLAVAVFVSHTVSSLILMPFICNIALESDHNMRVMAMCATWAMSAPMSLPTSSFPNLNSLSVDDDMGERYINASDYVKHGSVVGLVAGGLIMTLGYGLTYAVL